MSDINRTGRPDTPKSAPVAFTDPFGLAPCKPKEYLCHIAKAGFQALSGMAGLLGGWAAGTAACGPAAPVCAVSIAPALGLATAATTVTAAGAAFDNLTLFSVGQGGRGPTRHGRDRLSDPSRLNADETQKVIQNPTQRFTQADGAAVHVQKVGDRFNVAVVNKNNQLITNLKTINQKALNGLAERYGWVPQ